MTDRVEGYIDANQNRFVEELMQFMRIPSVSARRSTMATRGPVPSGSPTI